MFLPGVTYTPDHGLTVAGAAMRYFRRDTRGERASSMVLSVEASVQGKGMVSLDPNVWIRPYEGANADPALVARYDALGVGRPLGRALPRRGGRLREHLRA